MKEYELNTIMNVIADPDKCALNVQDKKLVMEIERIIRIFEINKQQPKNHFMFAIKSMIAMHLVLSNN